MRYAVVGDGVVNNIAAADAEIAAEMGWVPLPDDAGIGWTFDGEAFSPPVVPIADKKAAMRVAIRRHQEALFARGWTHDFGAAGVHTLDLRNADDKANWTLLLIKTQAMIAAGGGTMPVNIRTAANDTIGVTAAVANAAMVAFLAWGEGMLSAKWDLDEAIDAAADQAALDAIDIGAGWP